MLNKKRTGLIFVVSGPSGSGKTTLIKKLIVSKGFKKIKKTVSFTTRPRRTNERQFRDYDFISKTEFKKKLKNNEIIEYTKYLDFFYGTSKDRLNKIIEKGNYAILCLDTRGAFNIKKGYGKKSALIFILPPSENALKLRLNFRRRDTKKELKKRLGIAQQEIAVSNKFDHTIINDKLHIALKEMKDIVSDYLKRREK
ncbi:MAG: guanylate kinase [Candidatus Gygaella obscura]|nr:guanylate kinase [Candidatus Gygaella obscura]